MNITVYCGSVDGNRSSYTQAAIDTGKWIAQKGHRLIYGGGDVGLMGRVANTVLEEKGTVIGIIPEYLSIRENIHIDLTETIVVETLSQRKKIMFDMGDAFIALPGGPGTLDEITEVIEMVRVGEFHKPCILFDVDGYYQPLKAVYQSMVDGGYFGAEEMNLICVSSDFDEIERFIASF